MFRPIGDYFFSWFKYEAIFKVESKEGVAGKRPDVIATLPRMIFLHMSLFGFLTFKPRRFDLDICFTFLLFKFVSDPSLPFPLVHIDLDWFAFTVPLTHSCDNIYIYIYKYIKRKHTDSNKYICWINLCI